MFRLTTERDDRFFNAFRRDRRTPEKDTETVLGLDAKLAIAGWGEHDVIRQPRSANPDAADSVRHRTAPPGILRREQMVPCQREIRVRRARAARTTRAKTIPTITRNPPSTRSASGSFQAFAITEAPGSRCPGPAP